MITAYMGKFIKKDGSEREMFFCRLCDIPESFFILNSKSETPKNYPEGMELVWSLEDDNYRTFNHKTIVGKLKEVEIDNPFIVD